MSTRQRSLQGRKSGPGSIRHRAFLPGGLLAAVLLPLLPLLAITPVTQAKAETKAPLTWLRSQPLTLFDWGMLRLGQEMKQAATALADASQEGDRPIANAYYDWRRRQIIAYLSIYQVPHHRTLTQCRIVFRRLAYQLLRNAPEGPLAASWFLERIFVPPDRRWYRPSRDFGKRLVGLITFEITLRPRQDGTPFSDSRKVVCGGPLDIDVARQVSEVPR